MKSFSGPHCPVQFDQQKSWFWFTKEVKLQATEAHNGLSPNPVKTLRVGEILSVSSYNLYSLHAFLSATQKHLKKISITIL